MSHPYPTCASHQRGESLTSIVTMIVLFVLCLKLGLAIVPAHINDYKLDKAIASELKKANDNKESAKQLISGIQSQLTINGYYDVKLEDMYTLTNKTPGNFKMYKKYEIENNFLPNVFIVNRFEGELTAADSE